MLPKLLAVVFVIEYFRPQTYLPVLGALKITTLLPLAVIAASVFAGNSPNRLSNGEVLAKGNSKWLLFFLFLLVVSLLTSDVTLYSYNVLSNVFAFLLLYFVTTKEITTVSAIKGIFAALTAAHVLLVVFNPTIITSPDTRSYLSHAYLGDGNDFALSVNIVLPFCLFLLQDEPKKLFRLVALGGILIMILSVIGTASRGGTVGLACVLIYQWWRGRNKMVGVVALLVIAVVVFIYAPPFYFERLSTIAEYETEGSAQGRLSAWGSALRMVADHPILGVGSGHFPVKYGTEYFPPDIDGPSPWLTAHSIYFLILGELGIPGIVFLLFVIYGNLWRTDRAILRIGRPQNELEKRRRRLMLALNSGMIAYAVSGAFLSAVYYPHLFVLLALYNALGEADRRDFTPGEGDADVAAGETSPERNRLAPRRYRAPDA